jgi:Family of unknown function (DUF6082)
LRRVSERTAVPFHRRRWRLVAAGSLIAFAAAVLLAGIGLAATLSHTTDASTWVIWGNVGQTFESINALFSGLAFAAIVVTFWFQLRELREQRLELQLQRRSADGSRDALSRAVEADLRSLHLQLIKMSLDDPLLASVWPEVAPGTTETRRRQYLYVNLILQHARFASDLGRYDEVAIGGYLRYLLASPVIQEYWSASRAARDASTLDPRELRFVRLVEEVYREVSGGAR